MRGELLQPREQRVAVDDERQRLDDAAVGIGLHRGGQAHDARAGHQAVGVEHEHVLVGAAPAGDEILDIAGLAADVALAVAVEDAAPEAQALAQGVEGALLGDPGVGLGRIRQDEEVEVPRRPVRSISSIIAWSDAKTRAVASL